MKNLKIQANTFSTHTVNFQLSSNEKNHENSYSWCVPRKTKTVSSSGEFFSDSTKKTKIRTKTFRKNRKEKKKYRKIFQSRKRINELATPKLPVAQLSKMIKKCNLNYGIKFNVVTKQKQMERINKLAAPRNRDLPLTNIIGKIPKRALYATASDRIKELAQKKPLISDPEDKDEDPYKVKPLALKATCSMRTKALAVPKIFKLHSHFYKSGK